MYENFNADLSLLSEVVAKRNRQETAPLFVGGATAENDAFRECPKSKLLGNKLHCTKIFFLAA